MCQVNSIVQNKLQTILLIDMYVAIFYYILDKALQQQLIRAEGLAVIQ